MYILEDLIDLGLSVGQNWPTPAHRKAAVTLAIGNRYVTTKGALTTIVQAVIAIPTDKIKTVTVGDLPLSVRQYIPAPAA